MVYLDNAATTYPKPRSVYQAWGRAMTRYGANPGRAGHAMSMETSQAVFASRMKCAEFFGAEPENTVFTLNCTHALNQAVKGLFRPGAHYVVSDIEHNAVIRPVHALTSRGASYSLFETSPDTAATVRSAAEAIRPETVALVCTAAGNVTGQLLPIMELAALCRRKKICFIVDAAQGAGLLPLSLKDGINIICTAGHKGLYGPMGTGLMLTDGKYELKSLIEGGTGSASESLEQPDFLPDRFESGTINTPGTIALGAGVDFVRQKTPQRIRMHETALCRSVCAQLRRIPGIRVYSTIDDQPELYAPVVSFAIGGVPSAEASSELSKMGFYMRGGLHCAPLAHKKLGTLEEGTVRFAPSAFTTFDEVNALARAIRSRDWKY